jgi:hypothetical protein
MTDAQGNMLVLKDAVGNYFLVSQETLEQGRVPEEHRAQVERLVAEASTGEAGEGDDTQGYASDQPASVNFRLGAVTPLGAHRKMLEILADIKRYAEGRPPS